MSVNNSFEGMLSILKFNQESMMMGRMMDVALDPQRAKVITDTALKIRADNPKMTYEEAGKAAKKLLDIQ